jgi:hypothetical protein
MIGKGPMKRVLSSFLVAFWLVVQKQAFITWLVIVARTAFLVGTTKVVVNNGLVMMMMTRTTMTHSSGTALSFIHDHHPLATGLLRL